jgi:hypothetical protein
MVGSLMHHDASADAKFAWGALARKCLNERQVVLRLCGQRTLSQVLHQPVSRFQRWVVLGFAAAAMANAAAQDQAPLPVPGPPAQPVLAQPLPQDQLDALLAPIALYPDQLLAQVLMAATYPLEVVQAARWVQQNPSVQGEALDRALQDKNWDPSVLSLAAFPQVLTMMNDKLEWTQQLGDAFLANQAQVMDTVQNLRARAQEAGNLRSTP